MHASERGRNTKLDDERVRTTMKTRDIDEREDDMDMDDDAAMECVWEMLQTNAVYLHRGDTGWGGGGGTGGQQTIA